MMRLSRLVSLSPLLSTTYEKQQQQSNNMRQSWESEISVDSLTSVNSILSEEGSNTSVTSSHGELDIAPVCHGGGVGGGNNQQQAASLSLSCLLESVPPPSNTPDSMARESPRPVLAPEMGSFAQASNVSSVNSNNASSSSAGGSLFEQGLRLVKMGTKFKQQIEEIEAAKKRKQQQQQEQGNADDRQQGICDINTTPPGAQVVELVRQRAQLSQHAQLTFVDASSDEEVKKADPTHKFR
jgi:hypothetical protein